MTKIYLAHSIHEMKRGEVIENELRKMGFDVINPFKKNETEYVERLKETNLKNVWKIDNEGIANEIVKKDLGSIKNSDIFLALLPEEYQTCGTFIELAEAKNMNKIRIVVTKKMFGHPWIMTYADKIFRTIEEVYDYLERL